MHKRNEERYGETANVQNFRGKRTHYQYLFDGSGTPRVAKNCQPGQFVIVRMDKDGERIPLTICDYDREKGTITIVFQTVGAERRECRR